MVLLQGRGSRRPGAASELWALPAATIITLTAKPTEQPAFVRNPMVLSEEEYTLQHHLSLACNHPLYVL